MVADLVIEPATANPMAYARNKACALCAFAAAQEYWRIPRSVVAHDFGPSMYEASLACIELKMHARGRCGASRRP